MKSIFNAGDSVASFGLIVGPNGMWIVARGKVLLEHDEKPGPSNSVKFQLMGYPIEFRNALDGIVSSSESLKPFLVRGPHELLGTVSCMPFVHGKFYIKLVFDNHVNRKVVVEFTREEVITLRDVLDSYWIV